MVYQGSAVYAGKSTLVRGDNYDRRRGDVVGVWAAAGKMPRANKPAMNTDCELALEINPFRRPTMTPVLAQFVA